MKITKFNLEIRGKKIDLSFIKPKEAIQNLNFGLDIIIGTLLMCVKRGYIISFGIEITNFFEDYIKKVCCIDFVLIQKYLYSNIFESINEMSKKNDWNNFKLRII